MITRHYIRESNETAPTKWSQAESEFLDRYRSVLPPDGPAKPVRADLAIAALQVALKSDDADVRYGFTQSALDFLTGDYEALDDESRP